MVPLSGSVGRISILPVPMMDWQWIALFDSSDISTAPDVASTFPVNGATDFPINANLSVTFNEPVNVTSSWFSLVCSASGTVPPVFSGGPTTFTLDPGITLVNGETCTLTVLANQVSDQDGNDPPDNMVFNFIVGFTPMMFVHSLHSHLCHSR